MEFFKDFSQKQSGKFKINQKKGMALIVTPRQTVEQLISLSESLQNLSIPLSLCREGLLNFKFLFSQEKNKNSQESFS